MNSVEIKYLDGLFIVNESQPGNFGEISALIGEDAAVEEAVDNLRYRNKYPRVYRKVSAALVSELGFARIATSQKTMADKSIKDILESENDHLRAYLNGRKSGDIVITEAPSQEEVDGQPSEYETRKAALLDLFTTIATAEPLYVKGERTGGGGKISKDAQDNANALFAKGTDTVEKAASAIESRVGGGFKVGRDAEGNILPETLARGIMALNRAIEAEAKKASAGVLAGI